MQSRKHKLRLINISEHELRLSGIFAGINLDEHVDDSKLWQTIEATSFMKIFSRPEITIRIPSEFKFSYYGRILENCEQGWSENENAYILQMLDHMGYFKDFALINRRYKYFNDHYVSCGKNHEKVLDVLKENGCLLLTLHNYGFNNTVVAKLPIHWVTKENWQEIRMMILRSPGGSQLFDKGFSHIKALQSRYVSCSIETWMSWILNQNKTK